MKFFDGLWRPAYRGPRGGRSVGHRIAAGLGLAVLVAALVAAVGPYRQTREFRAVVTCERDTADCYDREPGSIVGRRTYQTTSTDGNGHTTTTTHFEVTWQRADGTRESRDVSSGFYRRAREGEPATVLLWRGDVVGVEVMGAAARFAPSASRTLGYWLVLAWFGLGVGLWGLLGWWDGLFMLGFRTFVWMFMSALPVFVTVDALAFGWPGGWELVTWIAFGLFFTGVAGWMLIGSLQRW